MSYRIEYAYRHLLARVIGGEMRHAIAVCGGDNNLIAARPGGRGSARARDWDIQFLGTERQIMAQACQIAGATAGGSLKDRRGDLTPECYIRRIERQLKQPTDGCLVPEIQCNPDEGAPLLADLRNAGVEVPQAATRWGQPWTTVSLPVSDKGLELLFELWDRYGKTYATWWFARPAGLPDPYSV